MLHITNGDLAADRIEQAKLGGECLPWRDVLHEGPVPAGLSHEDLSGVRAQFIATMRWDALDTARASFSERDAAFLRSRSEREVVLWFEHDLYDQLQVIQILAWYGEVGPPQRLSIAPADRYLSEYGAAALRELYLRRKPVSEATIEHATAVWKAFTGDDPLELEPHAWSYLSDLPHLAPALERLMEEFPSTMNGLSRSEQQLLRSLEHQSLRADEAFKRSHHDREQAAFLGDIVFASYVARLAGGPEPWIKSKDPALVRDPMRDLPRFWNAELSLTQAGRRALLGCNDWVASAGIDRWLGGVHLHRNGRPWRWNPGTRRLSLQS